MRSIADRFPLTASGVVLAVGSAAALVAGRRSLDLVLSLAGAWGLALVIVSGASTALAALVVGIRLRRALHDAFGLDAATVDRRVPTGLGLRWPIWPLVSRHPEWRWLAPESTAELERRADGSLGEMVRPTHRAEALEIVRRGVVTDALGLWRFPIRAQQAARTLVLPDTGALSGVDLAECLASGDVIAHPHGPAEGDRVDSRPYTRSDPARMILWKVYARHRELLVRTPEPARSPIHRPLLYLVAGEEDEPAAGTVRALWESGALGGGARFATAGTPVPVDGDDEFRHALARSYAQRERGAADLAAALAEPDVHDDPVVVACPARSGPWRDDLAAIVAQRPERFLILVCGDVVPVRRRTDASRVRRWVFRERRIGGTAWDDVLAAASAFRTTGARVAAVDRRGGRLLVVEGGVADGSQMATSA